MTMQKSGMSLATEASAKTGSIYNDEEVAQWFELACKFLERNKTK